MVIESEMVTTVVGSYPAKPSNDELMRSYTSRQDPFRNAIKSAVEAQLSAGIQIVTDGQTRNDMIRLFASGLRGFRIRERISMISDIAYRKPITVKDQIFVKEFLPKDKALKGIVTGPVTLVNSVDNEHYSDIYDAVTDAAAALRMEVKALSEVCDVIQIDEPYLSVEYPEYAGEVIDELVRNLDIPTALHVCGDVSKIAKELVDFNVDILDHEFAENPTLYDVYSDIDHNKKMAVGVVTTRAELESIDTIFARIQRAHQAFGSNCMLDPDCGLKMLPKNTASEKMRRIVAARDKFTEEFL